jgi:putative transposase
MTTIRQFSRITLAILAMTGRVSMRGISRWTGQGGSYRTVQRFLTTVLPWAALFWLFFRSHLFRADDVYLLAGDETVVTKAGKHTPGLDRFFASLYGKPVPGLAFFTLSLLSTRARRSFPIAVEQVLRSAEEKAAAPPKAAPAATTPSTKRKPGRPKGSSTKAKTSVELSPELTRIQTQIRRLIEHMGGLLPLTYLVLDGHFGTNAALQMALQCNLHLISKLRADSALYRPYEGPYAGRGPRRIYGDKLEPRALPQRYLRQTSIDKGIETRIYQLQARHKTFAQSLNVVCIVKTNLKSQEQAHVLLFSSDLALPFETLIDHYCLRFQLEESFRDDKSGGFSLEASHLTDPKRLDTLLLAFSVAVLWVYELGEQVLREDRRSEVDPAYKRQLSVFQLGWRLLRRLISCIAPPPCTLRLTPFKPEPVWYGKC